MHVHTCTTVHALSLPRTLMHTAGLSDRVCPSVCLCTTKYLTPYIHTVERLLNTTVTSRTNDICVPDTDKNGSIRRISSS